MQDETSPGVVRSDAEQDGIEERFLREFNRIIEEDPGYAAMLEDNLRAGNDARLKPQSSALGLSIERLRVSGTTIPLPDPSQVWALDGKAMDSLANILRSHSGEFGDDSASSVAQYRKILDLAEGYSSSIAYSPETIAQACAGRELDFRSEEMLGLANALAEARDRYLIKYATLTEEMDIASWPAVIAARRVGLKFTPDEAVQFSRKLIPELAELKSRRDGIGESYYAAVKGAVLSHLPEQF